MRALCRLAAAEVSRRPPRTAVAASSPLSSPAEEVRGSSTSTSATSATCRSLAPTPLMMQQASTSGRCSPLSRFFPLQRRSVWGEAAQGAQGRKRNGGAVEGFYDATVEQYALQPTEKLSLRQMLDFGRSALLDSSGKLLLASARRAQRELPKRLARRLMDLQLLPFIVVSNPHIRRVYDAYRHAFDTLVAFPRVETAGANLEFTELLRRLVDEHAPMLDLLAAGLREVDARPFAGPRVDLDAFLDAMLRSRVSRRVLAEHHIGLVARRPGHIGAVCADVGLKEAAAFAASKVRQACVEAYGVSPCVRISAGEGGGGGGGGGVGGGGGGGGRRNGVGKSSGIEPSSSVVFSSDDDGDSSSIDSGGGVFDIDSSSNSSNSNGSSPSMPYIPAHLDYCLYELLKNAARATVEASAAKRRARGERRTLALSARGATMPSFSSSPPASSPSPSSSPSSSPPSPFFGPLPPIVVRICDAPGKAATFRISDQGGGIPEEQAEAVWRYGFTTAGGGGGGGGRDARAADSPPPRSSRAISSAATMMMDAMMGEGIDPSSSSAPHSSSSSSSRLPSPPSSSSRWRMGGLGFGLPLSRLYSRYFGGDLRLVSMPGYGVDAFLTLEHLDGDWIEPQDEHVPVRPSAEPRKRRIGGGGWGGGGGGGEGAGGGESAGDGNSDGGGGKKGRKATEIASSSSSSPASDCAGSSRRRKRQSSDDDGVPRAALP